ncbi:hypothetical protein EVAR_103050_1 [Eumeta japonica]|uniref:Uncharacterized protein n=1 Tax=Eumeta variegata TaxID=151549 RepID=A0A4C1WEY4_EUMVA|nr:hypothetical protein EVAR_103050_1 [Eumeta japonica]
MFLLGGTTYVIFCEHSLLLRPSEPISASRHTNRPHLCRYLVTSYAKTIPLTVGTLACCPASFGEDVTASHLTVQLTRHFSKATLFGFKLTLPALTGARGKITYRVSHKPPPEQ